MILRTFLLLALAGLAAPVAAAPLPRIDFVAVEPRFAPAAEAYERLWREEGARIIEALEQASGLAFPDTPMTVIVSNGPPMTSYDGGTIRLSARYPDEYRRATFVHELGHRLALTLGRESGLDDHRLLYLFLHEAWTSLYGEEFADRMAAIEQRIRGPADYRGAWAWALALKKEGREARLSALRALRPLLPYAELDLAPPLSRASAGRPPGSGSR